MLQQSKCNVQNETSVDPLTSFDGGVSWGHVGLLIFHNSPVKTLGGLTHTYTHLSPSHTYKPQTPCYVRRFLNSTCRHLTQKAKLELSYYLLLVLAPGPAQAFENMHCHRASSLSLQRHPQPGHLLYPLCQRSLGQQHTSSCVVVLK